MNESNKLLSDIVAFRTYSKYLSHLSRRESLAETINRNMNMHLDRFPKLSGDIVKAYQRVHNLQVMPSMRALQFSGPAIQKNELRSYNCSYAPVNDIAVFSEALYLLLSGVGFGFSVQKHHVNQLPKITLPREEGFFVIHDSIMGWAQALDLLMKAYMLGQIKPQYDYGNIRPKGSYMVTTGAKAPGPEPLKKMLENVEQKLKLALGRKLTPIEVHDIICIVSDAVLAGGVRRSALISLFDRDDKDMLKAKSGEWWVNHPYRARANNSAMLPRKEVTEEEFREIFKICKDSNAGEPGFFWSSDPELNLGANPCVEISLNPHQMCNLTTINQTGIKSEKDFLNRVYAATLIGTLQASYTDFSYLRDCWKIQTDKEALLGVSFTGIADNHTLVNDVLLRKGAELSLEVNEKYAKKIGINLAARIGTIKPEGSSSCVLGSSSGIHSRHSPYYLRRVRMNKDDVLATYLKSAIPELVEDDQFSSTGVVVTIPQESPAGALVRDQESADALLKRALMYRKNWIEPSHREGINKHNVSVTISVKEDEWDSLRDSMWKARNSYSGISLLPYDNSTYVQAPFEECTKDKYEELNKQIKEIDLKMIKEESDNTVRTESIACSGGQCEIL